jgi:CRP-like cAMP-binding protein
MEERKIGLKDLKNISLFNALPKKTLNELVGLGSLRVYQPGAIIYQAGTINSKVIITLRGSISINYAYTKGQVPVEIVSEGNVWGYTTLLNPGKKYPYNVINSDTALEVIELPVTKLLRFVSRAASDHLPLLYELGRLQSQRSRQRQQKIALLYTIADILNSLANEKTKLKHCLEIVSVSLQAEYGLISWFDDISKSIVIEASLNYGEKIEDKNYPLDSDTVLSRVYNTNEPMRINKHNFETKFNSAPYNKLTMLIVPLYSNKISHGAVMVASKKKGEFSLDDELMLKATAPMLTATLLALHKEQYDKHNKILKNDYV